MLACCPNTIYQKNPSLPDWFEFPAFSYISIFTWVYFGTFHFVIINLFIYVSIINLYVLILGGTNCFLIITLFFSLEFSWIFYIPFAIKLLIFRKKNLIFLSTLLLMGIWVVSSLGLLWLVQLLSFQRILFVEHMYAFLLEERSWGVIAQVYGLVV